MSHVTHISESCLIHNRCIHTPTPIMDEPWLTYMCDMTHGLILFRQVCCCGVCSACGVWGVRVCVSDVSCGVWCVVCVVCSVCVVCVCMCVCVSVRVGVCACIYACAHACHAEVSGWCTYEWVMSHTWHVSESCHTHVSGCCTAVLNVSNV